MTESQVHGQSKTENTKQGEHKPNPVRDSDDWVRSLSNQCIGVTETKVMTRQYIWQHGQLELAEDMFKRNLHMNPNFWETYYSYGAFLQQHERPEEAIVILKKVSMRYSHELGLWSLLRF